MSFVHLQTHSEFSLLRSSCRIHELLAEAVKNNQPAVALTDHGNMFGVLEFYMQALSLNKDRKKNGLPPIKALLGSHIYVATSTANTKEESSYHRLTLIAKTNEGYRNLLKIVSYCYEDAEQWNEIPAVPLDYIREKSAGLIALAGDFFSRFGLDILNQKEDLARQYLVDLSSIFDSESLYFMVQDQEIEGQKKVNAFMLQASEELHRGLVAVNNVHYIEKGDAPAHKVLRCIALAEKLQNFNDPLYPTDKFYFKTTEEMKSAFREYPQAIENTVKIAEQCDITIKTNCGSEFWPQFKFPDQFKDSDEYLAHLCRKKVSERYPEVTPEVIERMETELACIKTMLVAGYLLIVWDFINWSRENGIPVGPGRGSAAGSIVTYIIGITDIDPLRFDLLFERFLNPERVSMPDIDTDFSDRDRSRVIQYVSDQYGKECVTQIVTYGALKMKAVINDVGRVLGIPFSDVRTISKLLPTDLGATLQMAKTGKNKKGDALDGYNPGPLNELIESRQTYRDLWNYSEKLENLSRQTGVHAAAVIIAPVPMSNLAPLFRARKEDTPVIMYDKHYAEDIGLLKMDFLGLRNLSIIQDAVALIKQTRNIDLEIGRIPLDDAKTFDLLSKGLTVGVFQFESPGMREYLRKLIPERIEDLIAMNALYRPGPIEQIPHYIARKRGEEPIDCYHKDLEPILNETYGVIVYQEQVMRIAQKLGGYTLGGADVIRRIMAKKKPEEMARLEPEFLKKCIDRGYKESLIKEVWKVLLPFCGYAFNKSHAAAYAYVAYQTAFLKANYGPEFMAASMTSEISKTENIVNLLKECSKMDIPYLGPNINSSLATFSVDGQGRILYGLAGIKNVGISIVEDIVDERTLHGEYKDIFDLCKRLLDYQASFAEKKSPLSKKVLESLVMSGALDVFPGSRSALLATIDKAIEVASRYRENKDCGQVSIFDLGDSDTSIHTAEELEDAEEWTYIELLNKEKDVLGMFISGHPLEEYRPELQGFTTCSLAESEINNSGLLKRSITIGGVITKMRSFETRRGDTLGSGIIQDFQGEIALFLTSDKWEAFRDRISIDDRVLVQGILEMQRDDKGLQVVVEKIVPLETVRQKWVQFLHISIPALSLTEEKLNLLSEKLNQYEPFPGETSCQMVFHIESLSGYEHALQGKKIRFKYEQDLLVWLKKDFGVTDTWVSNKSRS